MKPTDDRVKVSGWCAPIAGKPDCAGCRRHDRPCACPTCERLREGLSK